MGKVTGFQEFNRELPKKRLLPKGLKTIMSLLVCILMKN
jgi:hypothetical protein